MFRNFGEIFDLSRLYSSVRSKDMINRTFLALRHSKTPLDFSTASRIGLLSVLRAAINRLWIIHGRHCTKADPLPQHHWRRDATVLFRNVHKRVPAERWRRMWHHDSLAWKQRDEDSQGQVSSENSVLHWHPSLRACSVRLLSIHANKFTLKY